MPIKKPDLKSKDELEQEIYYVGISEPLEIRRTVLETSKSIIQAMHRFEKYREYREQKLEEIKKLNKQMTELGSLIGSLKYSLPKNTVRVKKAREEVLAQRKVQDVAVTRIETKKDEKPALSASSRIIKTTPKRELTELEKLELELSSIESKLSSLTK